ncbi:B3/4 domain-containing protein [Kouleothrix sp.]|uniref:B3/B4 domain-containing protein n=1 Tax=Kouleothrix sp. TaxID=2779161 RepID=UPI00391948B7
MYFMHTPPIWRDFPQLAAGLIVAEGIDPTPDVAARLEPLFERAAARLAAGSEAELPEIQAWRRAYAQMGLKPTQYRSAAEALLRRFRREGALPQLHPLVDICNAVSLAFALPVAVFDLAGVEGFIEVRYADGDELYLAFSGEAEHPDPGEVIFGDAARQVHARRWTFRQGRRSTVSAETGRALIVSEGLHAGAADDVAALLATLAGEIGAVWRPVAGPVLLSAARPRYEFG